MGTGGDYIIPIISNNCPICLEIVNENNELCSCGTSYHEECFIKWVVNQKTCPTCRKEIKLTKEQYVFAIKKKLINKGIHIDNSNSDENYSCYCGICLFVIFIFFMATSDLRL